MRKEKRATRHSTTLMNTEPATEGETREPKRIGLALSGGGARGIAHIGVLAALDELGVRPAMISGVSSGAIIGAFYAAGWEPRRILRQLTETNIRALLRPAFTAFGLLRPSAVAGAFGLLRADPVEALYIRLLGSPDVRFEDLQIPLIIGTVDLIAGESVYYCSGPLLRPLLASAAVPVLYQPVAFENRLLIDGGLLSNLPVEPLLDDRAGVPPCEAVIGVHTNPIDRAVRPRTLRGLIERTMHLAINNNVRSRLALCDVVLEPPTLRRMSLWGYQRSDELFRIGYDYTMSHRAELERLR